MEYLLSKMMHDDASNVTKFGNYFANVTIARFSMNFFFFLFYVIYIFECINVTLRRC